MTPPDPTLDATLADAAPAAPAGDPARAAFRRQLHILGDLAEAGLAMAQAVAAETAALGPDRSVGPRAVADLALAFERVSRAVRYAVMLQSRVMGEFQAWERAQTSAAAMDAWLAQAAAEAERADRAAAGEAASGDKASGDAGPEMLMDPAETEGAERPEREGVERLRDEAGLAAILKLPVSEVIAMICRDLGVQPDWLRLPEQEWAQGEPRSGKVGAALAAAVLSGEAPEEAVEPGGEGRTRPPLSRPTWRPPIRTAEAPRRRRAAG